MGNGPSRPSLKNCTLWKADRSPACRAVMMALDAMNINVREVDVNLDEGEHRSPEITAMNPRQTLPILKDNDLVLCDSNAIASYMAGRYGASAANMLLPTDAAGRALVEQFMHFNSSVLYPQYKAASNPILYQNCRVIAMPTFCEIHCAYYDLENILKDRLWFNRANWPSLGDIMLAATVSTLHILVPIQKRKYPLLASWLTRISKRSFYITANKKGLAEFAKRIDITESTKESKRSFHKEGSHHQEPSIKPSRHTADHHRHASRSHSGVDTRSSVRPRGSGEFLGDTLRAAVDPIPGDSNEGQKSVKYRGGRCCYLADLPKLRRTEKILPRAE